MFRFCFGGPAVSGSTNGNITEHTHPSMQKENGLSPRGWCKPDVVISVADGAGGRFLVGRHAMVAP